MKARLPAGYGGGPQNMNQIMKQAQKMQDDMQKAQEELATKEYTVKVGGGMVEMTMLGSHEVTGVKINPDAVSPDEVEMLEELVAAAVNEAIRVVDEDSAQRMEGITGGLNLPGIG